MENTINIGSTPVKLNNNVGWVLAYRDQFGRDIIPSIMPLLAGILDVISGVIAETGKTKDVTAKDILAVVDGDRLMDAAIHFSGLEMSDFIHVVWALAKCADSDIPEPKEWIRQFDVFPLDVIVPEVVRLIGKGLVSSKNLKRLEMIKESLQPMIKA